jgi:hypothetical protein
VNDSKKSLVHNPVRGPSKSFCVYELHIVTLRVLFMSLKVINGNINRLVLMIISG